MERITRPPRIYIRADDDTPLVQAYQQQNIETMRHMTNAELAQLWGEVQQWMDNGGMPEQHYVELMEIIDNELASRFSRNVTVYN